MANGGKKKSKRNEEREMKKRGEEEARLAREYEEKRARIIASVAAARELQKQQSTSTSREKEGAYGKKKGAEDKQGKRAEDNKRRDSLGGSVSTSSNSSGTDCDEMLSEAQRRLAGDQRSSSNSHGGFPDFGGAADAATSAVDKAETPEELQKVMDTINEICEQFTASTGVKPSVDHRLIHQMAQSMVASVADEGAREASAALSAFPPNTDDSSGDAAEAAPAATAAPPAAAAGGKNKNFKGRGANLATSTEDAVNAALAVAQAQLSSSRGDDQGSTTSTTTTTSSPTPRVVTTPILTQHGGSGGGASGRSSVVSPAAAAAADPAAGGFRPIDAAAEMQSAAVTTVMPEDRELVELPRAERAMIIPEDQPFRNTVPSRAGFPMYKAADEYRIPSSFNFMSGRNPILNGYSDPLVSESLFGTGYERRGEFVPQPPQPEREMTTSVTQQPDIWFLVRPPALYELPMTSEYPPEEVAAARDEERRPSTWLLGERKVFTNMVREVDKLLEQPSASPAFIREMVKAAFGGDMKKIVDFSLGLLEAAQQQHQQQQRTDCAKQNMNRVAETLLNQSTSAEHGFSLVHMLAGQGLGDKACGGDDRPHQKCIVLQALLGCLLQEPRGRALGSRCSSWGGRQPLHIAAATGQRCQLQALLEFRPNVSLPDAFGMTPVFCAAVRNQVIMLRMLAVAGADLQQMNAQGKAAVDWQEDRTKRFALGAAAVDFIARRTHGFETAMRNWFPGITSALKLDKACSEVHVVSCYPHTDIEDPHINGRASEQLITQVKKTIFLRPRASAAVNNEDRAKMFLIMMPFIYLGKEPSSPAEWPLLQRQSLFYEEVNQQTQQIKQRPVPLLEDHPILSCVHPTRATASRPLVPLLVHHHTGEVYIYKMFSDVAYSDRLSISFSLDLTRIKPSLRKNLRLMAQLFTIQRQ